ncbi:mitochondrial inner membrane protease subunit 2 isoform X1 [Erythrolamprus reginae]|uniref:mitochondrial inner membrane protease subunit 2 isoform X1 n=1 Tax=Erythrolamprus reginae TaxID=121349 RepID=UPI00396CF571
MIQMQGFGRRYIKAFLKGFFVAVPVTVTFLDRVACIARVEGTSMQPSLNPVEQQVSDIVLLNHWTIQNYKVERGDIVSLVSPRNPEQKIVKRVIALEGDIIKTIAYKQKYVKIPHGHIWVEGDHHGHSFDSNAFGPVTFASEAPLPSSRRPFDPTLIDHRGIRLAGSSPLRLEVTSFSKLRGPGLLIAISSSEVNPSLSCWEISLQE